MTREFYLDYDCTKHGKGRSPSGDCLKCLEEADREAQANEGPHGLCSSCNNADWERSSAFRTWCHGWTRKGFPVKHIPAKRCKKWKPIPPEVAHPGVGKVVPIGREVAHN